MPIPGPEFCERCEDKVAIGGYLFAPGLPRKPHLCLACALDVIGELSPTKKIKKVQVLHVDENTRPENEREDF